MSLILWTPISSSPLLQLDSTNTPNLWIWFQRLTRKAQTSENLFQEFFVLERQSNSDPHQDGCRCYSILAMRRYQWIQIGNNHSYNHSSHESCKVDSEQSHSRFNQYKDDRSEDSPASHPQNLNHWSLSEAALTSWKSWTRLNQWREHSHGHR